MQRERAARQRRQFLEWLQLAAVGFTALALVPTGAYLLDISFHMRLAPDDYLALRRSEIGWTALAVAGTLAVFAIGTHAYMVRRNAGAFGWSMVALLGVGAAQLIYWSVAFPIDVATEGWSTMPADFEAARQHWEYSFATAAALTFGGLLAMVRAIEASRPLPSLTILESIERDAAVRAARTRALRGEGSNRQTCDAVGADNRAA